MKIITDHKLIKRNKRIGQITTFAAMGLLGVGLYLTFTQIYILWSFGALLGGFLLSQFGIYYGSRWGRSPRPDELLNLALKGLDNKYTLYHYVSPAPHLLLGPAGIWVLTPLAQRGVITYDPDKKRWRQKGGNLYMKIFAQEGLGRPDLEVQEHARALEKYVRKVIESETQPPIESVLVFTHEDAVVNAEGAPLPALPAKKLKEFIRRQAKTGSVSSAHVVALEEKFPKETSPGIE